MEGIWRHVDNSKGVFPGAGFRIWKWFQKSRDLTEQIQHPAEGSSTHDPSSWPSTVRCNVDLGVKDQRPFHWNLFRVLSTWLIRMGTYLPLFSIDVLARSHSQVSLSSVIMENRFLKPFHQQITVDTYFPSPCVSQRCSEVTGTSWSF